VVENLTYEFDGGYNGILSSFDVGDVEGMDDLKLYVDGGMLMRQVDALGGEPFTYTLVREGRFVNVKAYAPGDGGQRTFGTSTSSAASPSATGTPRGSTTKLIGISNQATLGRATIRVTFPGAPTHWYAHGAMGAEDLSVGADGPCLRRVRRTSAGEYVEITRCSPRTPCPSRR
jgi:hypothetical protein